MFELSSYQKNILDYIKYENGNLLVNAKAGSGKTSTLILISEEIIKQNKKCLFLAFGKDIITELQRKIISDDCQIKTLHALGRSFVLSYLYKKYKENYDLTVDKTDEFIKEKVKKLFVLYCEEDFKKENEDLDESDFKDLYYNIIREISQMVNFARLYNIDYNDYNQVYNLGWKLCYNLKEYEELGLKEYPAIVRDIINDLREKFENPELNDDGLPTFTIGFTDMIYFPCLYNMTPPWSIRPYLEYVLLDESQDFSVLQQLFIKLLNNHFNTRFIFVGDEKQAIYGFAGADTKSIYNLKKNFYLKELPLNICYRCPENIIKLSQSLVPEIDWNHNREDKGIVKFFKETDLDTLIKPGDIIIGRRNKDLVRIYKELVLNKKTEVKFQNAEMVTSIVNEIDRCIKDYIKFYNQCLNVEKDLYKLCDENNINWKKADNKMTKEEKEFIQTHYTSLVKDIRLTRKNIMKKNYTLDYLLKCMEDYKNNGAYNFIFEGMNENVLIDYFEVIEDLIMQYKDLKESVLLKDFSSYLEGFLKGNLNKNVPILSSIHKMKGGEADNVYILDYPRFPYIYNSQTEDTQQQERNLQYVALTRAKKNLYLGYISKPNRPREDEEDIIIKNKDCEAEVKQRLMLK